MSDLAKNDESMLASADSNVLEFFKSNANVGAENLSSSIPQLKITEPLSDNVDAAGNQVAPGTFFYAPTKEAFKEIDVAVLNISRGFWALDNQKEPRPKFTQLVGGIMLGSLQPFIMFVSGTRLPNLWSFGKEINPYTKSKQSPIPMMAFTVKLSLEKMKTDFGQNHVVKYELIRNDKGQPQIITDLELLTILKKGVDQTNEMFNSFIAQKEVDRNTGLPLAATPTTYEAEVTNEGGQTNSVEDEVAENVVEELPF
jgi:hypothetical protein